jgi:hypothetical protein
MPRYFFNLVSQQGTVSDHEGIEVVGDFDLLIVRIIEEIEEMRSEEPELFDIGGDWYIEVVDGEGRRLARLPL